MDKILSMKIKLLDGQVIKELNKFKHMQTQAQVIKMFVDGIQEEFTRQVSVSRCSGSSFNLGRSLGTLNERGKSMSKL